MGAPKIFLEGATFPPELRPEGAEAHYLERVRRIREGEEVLVLGGEGRLGRYRAEFRGGRLVLVLIELESRVCDCRNVTIFQPLLPKQKLDLCFQKLCELEVDRIIVFRAARSVAVWSPGQVGEKLSRAELLMRESCRQCGRTSGPEIGYADSLESAVAVSTSSSLRFFLWECQVGEAQPRPAAQASAPWSSAVACVGPEGGFADEEVGLLRDAGFVPVHLGRAIMKSETASFICAALANLTLGRWKLPLTNLSIRPEIFA